MPVIRARPSRDDVEDPDSVRRARRAAVCVLLLGVVGIAIGSTLQGAATELLVGAILVVLAARALFYIGRR